MKRELCLGSVPRVLAALAGLALALGGATAAESQEIFSEDFSAYTVGALCCDWGTPSSGWEMVYSGQGYDKQVVVPDPGDPANKVVQMWGYPGWSAVIKRVFDTTDPETGLEYPVLAWRFRIRIEALGSQHEEHPGFYCHQGEYPPYDPWGTYYGYVGFRHAPLASSTPPGHGEIWSEAGGTLLGYWAPGTWQEVMVLIDRDPTSPGYGRYSVWVDDTLAGSDLELSCTPRYVSGSGWVCDGQKHPERLDSVTLVSAHAGVKVYYDDISVFVPGSGFWMDQASDAVSDLLASGTINGGQARALTVKLAHAMAKLEAGKPWVAQSLLEAFVNQVEDFVLYGVLTPEEAAPLLSAAQHALDAIQP